MKKIAKLAIVTNAIIFILAAGFQRAAAQSNSVYINQAIAISEFAEHVQKIYPRYSPVFGKKDTGNKIATAIYDSTRTDTVKPQAIPQYSYNKTKVDSVNEIVTTVARDDRFNHLLAIITKAPQGSDSGDTGTAKSGTKPTKPVLTQPKGGPSYSDEWSEDSYSTSWNQPDIEEDATAVYDLETMLIVAFGTDEQVRQAKGRRLVSGDRLARYLKNLRNESKVLGIAPQSFAQNVTGGYGFNEATVIYGIADWIIARAKAELLASVFDKIYNVLSKDTISKTLLSNTLKTYDQFKLDQSVNLAKYGELWKASFEEDLSNLPVHFSDENFVGLVIDNVAPGWTYRREVVPLIAGGTTFVYGITQKKHPVNILSELGTEYLTSAAAANADEPLFKRAVLFTDVLTDVLGQFSDNIYKTISLTEVKNLTPAQWKNFLRVIYLPNATKLTLAFGHDPAMILTEIQNGPGGKLYNLLVKLGSTYQAIQEILANHDIGGAGTVKNLTSKEVGKMIDLAASLLSSSLPYVTDNMARKVNAVVELISNEWQPVVQSITQVGQGVASKQYGAALDGTLQLLNRANKIYSSLAGISSSRDTVIQYLTKYGSFMVNILSAKKPEDVQTALDELVPPNQYKLKNTSYWSVSASAYPGIFYGREKLTTSVNNPQPSTFTPKATSLGVYCPIGVDFSRGFGNSSLTLFLQVVDLGAVLNYRLNGSDTAIQTNPSISWQQLLSPGGSLMFRIWNTPLVVGYTVNYTSALRKVDQGGIVTDANSLRQGVFLAVDVTALHISISKHKYPQK